ncbi:MAG: class I SAM-dependent methyltransferase [Eubacterium sp.]|nr:class I SAM-dependent methyltransferase [Eubacterium sp.]
MKSNKDQIEAIAKSYDKGIDMGRKGIDLYENLPEEITNHPDYVLFEKMKYDGNLSDSGRKEILDYLLPEKGMKFVDLGCCLNLMFRGYESWPSTYYGVDISSKTIDLLRSFTAENDIKIGDLYHGSMSETPYAENFFDIGACIGSLEYFEKDFVEKAIAEAHKIIKPYGRYVIDIPNMGTPEFQITARIEEYLGRPDRFNMSIGEFEVMLADYFEVRQKEEVGPMIQYFLVNLEN